MSEKPFLSINLHANGIEARYSAQLKAVHIRLGGIGASLVVPVDDAERLMESLAVALAAARGPVVATPTESGMTELDCALLQTKPSREAVTE